MLYEFDWKKQGFKEDKIKKGGKFENFRLICLVIRTF